MALAACQSAQSSLPGGRQNGDRVAHLLDGAGASRRRHGTRSLAFAVALLSQCLRPCGAQCLHQNIGVETPDGNITSGNASRLMEGVPVFNRIRLNRTRLYWYENFNTTTMNEPERFRKLIIQLEPCIGVVYLLMRKTRPCWPEVHSCCHPLPGVIGVPDLLTAPPCSATTHSTYCLWTHFHSPLDGNRDGAPTFFEIPFSSTSYYLTVFAPEEPNARLGISLVRYRISVLSDIGSFPRPGLQGRLTATQVSGTSVELQWNEATFLPEGISRLKHYNIYSSLLLPSDEAVNEAVFLNANKVMNTVCGLEANAAKYGQPLSNANCLNGVCRATIYGMVPQKRYVLNVVAESDRPHDAAYSGIIVQTHWHDRERLFGDDAGETVTALVGAICGTIVGVVVIGYLWIVKFYV